MSVKVTLFFALLTSLIFARPGTAQDAAPTPAALPTPILALSFDDSNPTTDDSRSGNIYTLTGVEDSGDFTPATAPSFSGSGLAWAADGTHQQRIEIDDGDGLGDPLTVPAFTMMADVNITGNDTDPAHNRWEIAEKAGSYWCNIRYGPPKLLRVGGFFSGTQTDSFTGTTTIPVGVWTNLAFVFDPSTHKLITYVNGVFDHDQAQAGTLDPSIIHNGLDEKLVVGAKHRVGGVEILQAFFDGLMDNYRLYNVALSATQIASIAGTPVSPLTAPAIVRQPVDVTVSEGMRARFRVSASGDPPLSYQWRKNGTDIVGAIGTVYTTPPTTLGDDGELFSVRVTNNGGSILSRDALLKVVPNNVPPSIVTEPADASVRAGRSATFSVTASGSVPLSYQWHKNGSDIQGATKATYKTPPTTLEDNGALFSVTVSNHFGSVPSRDAVLTVR